MNRNELDGQRPLETEDAMRIIYHIDAYHALRAALQNGGQNALGDEALDVAQQTLGEMIDMAEETLDRLAPEDMA